jgi:hypothetical protein
LGQFQIAHDGGTKDAFVSSKPSLVDSRRTYRSASEARYRNGPAAALPFLPSPVIVDVD